jgi:cyclohexanone monooxygenase
MKTDNQLESNAYDAIVVGAGFAGLYMLHRLRLQGMRVRVFEAGDGVGGTWFWNCYPGARCDVESMQYSYSFSEEIQQAWVWSERYPRQEEILKYINHVADHLNLRTDIQFNTQVNGGHFQPNSTTWSVQTSDGQSHTARFLITATGCLSASRVPDMPGLDGFKGEWFHTGQWPKTAVDFKGKRVGVIGTGSSGIQLIPMIAKEAKELVVFQRTPNFSIPAWNRPLSIEEQDAWKASYAEHRQRARNTRSGILYDYSTRATTEVSKQDRDAEYERRWAKGGANFTHAFTDIFTNRESNELAAEFVRNKIRSIVKDPAVADRLTPKDHAIGTKRICVDTDYYSTFNNTNVKLVDIRATPLQEIKPNGIQTSDALFDLDCIVFATGYDAVTGALERLNIQGEAGQSLKDEWTTGPRTYLGLMTVGFPNLFFITGPGSPSILTNVIVSIEQHVDWIARCIQHMNATQKLKIQAQAPAQEAWVQKVNDLAKNTLFPASDSWYMGANVPGKPRVFLPFIGGLGTYTEICEQVIKDGYSGFDLAATH